MKQLLVPAAAIIVLASVMIIQNDPYELHQPDCELVEMWNQDRDRGIAPERRLGRPAITVEERNYCANLKKE